MFIYRKLSEIPVLPNVVLTIGVFDGVHLGHLQILKQLCLEAQQISGTPIVITFEPHPRKILQPGNKKPVHLLTTLDEKLALFANNGIEHVMVVSFNEDFAHQTAEAYIHDFLFNHFHPHTIIVGYDHRFGKGRQGDYRLLEQEGKKLGFTVKEIPEQLINHITVSSTRIREALLAGNIVAANELLGYAYPLSGKVVHGNKRGRTIGFPTANISVDNADKLIPAVGVYAVQVKLGDEEFRGMMNIGYRPTVDGTTLTLEVNILNFDRDIYGQVLQLSFLKKLREEKKFSGLEALKQQLEIDRQQASEV